MVGADRSRDRGALPAGVRRRLAGGTGWDHGETYEQLRERVLEALHEIAARHDGARALVVTHGGPIGQVWLACGLSLDHRPRVGNCEVLGFEIGGGAIARID